MSRGPQTVRTRRRRGSRVAAPIWFFGPARTGARRYTYTGDDPINNISPSGRCSGLFECAGRGAVIGTVVGAIIGGVVGGVATGGIGVGVGAFNGGGEGAVTGTVIGAVVGVVQDVFF